MQDGAVSLCMRSCREFGLTTPGLAGLAFHITLADTLYLRLSKPLLGATLDSLIYI